MAEEWEFLRDARRTWYWRRTDERGTHRVSAGVFATKDECEQDAIAHGYVRRADEAANDAGFASG